MDGNRPNASELGINVSHKEIDIKNPLSRTVDRLTRRESFNFVEINSERFKRHLELSGEVAKDLLSGKYTVKQALDRISKDRSIRHFYPDLLVPQTFLEQRPNIVFAALSIDKYKPIPKAGNPGEMYNNYGDLFESLESLGVDKEKIIDLNHLKDTLPKIIALKANPNIKGSDLETVIKRLIHEVYFGNLELYRLAKDSEGAVMRFVSDKELDGSESVKDFAPWSFTLSSGLQSKAYKNYVSYWWRKDARHMNKYLGKKKAVATSLSELEKSNFIALDKEEENALATIRINSDADGS